MILLLKKSKFIHILLIISSKIRVFLLIKNKYLRKLTEKS